MLQTEVFGQGCVGSLRSQCGASEGGWNITYFAYMWLIWVLLYNIVQLPIWLFSFPFEVAVCLSVFTCAFTYGYIHKHALQELHTHTHT